MESFPRSTAPASASRVTIAASRSGRRSAYGAAPKVVRIPARVDEVLQAVRDAVERPAPAPGGELRLGGPGVGAGALRA